MYSTQTLSLLILLTTPITLAAPTSLNPREILRRGSAYPSATTYTCEGDVLQITNCNSKTSTVSCHNVADFICNKMASDRDEKSSFGWHTEGTCSGRGYTNGHAPTYGDCMAAFTGINDGCLAPNERPDPDDNLPIMRGWQNTDPGNAQPDGRKGCGYAFDPNFPSYELASNNCAGKWGTGCAGGDNGGLANMPPPGSSGGGGATGASSAARPPAAAGGIVIATGD